MKQYYLFVLIIGLLSSFVFSQEEVKEKRLKEKLQSAKLNYTETGNTASHQNNYIYLVDSDENGKTNKVKSLNKENLKFVNEEDIITCIKPWKLRPSSRNLVLITYGTTSTQFHMSIRDLEKK